METIERSIKFVTELTVEEVAKAFCEMNSGEQAIFFNTVHTITSEWVEPFHYQLYCIVTDEALTEGGRLIMSQIGEYSRR